MTHRASQACRVASLLLGSLLRSYLFLPVLSAAFGYRWGGKPEREQHWQ
jgi:hypothetical protein